jgi:hypothetical protein
MLKLIERACTAKDFYDLTDPDGRAQAAADYQKYGPFASEYVALLREFGHSYSGRASAKGRW